MIISRLRVEQFRTHHVCEVALDPRATVITGPNGSGKTSLIEALYIALQGSSFKGVDTDIIKHGTSWYRIDISDADGDIVRTVKFDGARTTGRKQFVVGGKTMYRLAPAHKYPVVLFEPEDLRLLHGSPARRRAFLDTFISQLDPQYTTSLRRYERALKQRNALLKQPVADDSLFAWDVSLSEYGAYITAARQKMVALLDGRLGAEYRSIAHTDDTIGVAYSYAAAEGLKQKLLTDLHANARRDQLLGYTSTGPHRHDVLFSFNNSPALEVASRGEVRSIVLALKFLEVTLIEQITDKKPIVLLDDVFSELDSDRQSYLANLAKDNQMVITSATNNATVTASRIVQL